MEINVNLEPEQINKAVADAIIKSAIGVELDKVIKAQVQSISTSYDSPIKNVVAREIQKAVEDVVRAQYGDFIKSKVAEMVTEQFTEDLFKKMWDSFTNRY